MVNQRRDHYRVSLSTHTCDLDPYVASPGGRLRGEAGYNRPAQASTLYFRSLSEKTLNESKLSTTDLLVLASMKNAAKCDK